MIQRLELHNFKAFERFTLHVRHGAYLAGPNNAGKSTIIAALRAAASMLRIAQRRRPTDMLEDRNREVLAYYFDSSQVTLVDENLRHEFRDLEARISVQFSGKSTLNAVWPREDDDQDPFFYLLSDGFSVQSARDALQAFPQLGIVPILSPVDQAEAHLTPKYVRENLDGRLASRHFRNQLWLLRDEQDETENLDAFLSFAEPWLSELRVRELASHLGARDVELDLYYREPGRRSDKEIFWAGDGIQIWLQLLLHVFRLRAADVLILDEPDVFLHPDLQRRLVRLLDTLRGQTITATHATEVLAEAPPESIVWVDRMRRRSVAAPDSAALAELTTRLGSQFNIRLARALRAKVVLFVEGQDMKLIRHVAATVGADHIARELDITVIPLHGFDNWDRVEPFKWLVRDLLEDSIAVFVVLDRDYRPEDASISVKRRLGTLGVKCVVWKRKELESYFLEVSVLARLSGAEPDWIAAQLAAVAAGLEDFVFALFTTQRQKLAAHDHQVQAVQAAKREFDALWASNDARLEMCSPKEVLAQLNQRLQTAGHQAVSFPGIARAMRPEEVPSELANFLARVEEACN